MSAAEFNQWLERGRAHEAARRPVEALSCFRRAAQLRPTAVEPHFRAGAAYWGLGRFREALAAWEAAARGVPAQAAPWLALAEAQLGLGDATAALAAAQRAHELDAGDSRAVAAMAVSTLALTEVPATGDAVGAAVSTLAGTLRQKPWLAGIPALAGMLSRVIDRIGTAPALVPLRDALVDVIANPAAGSIPLTLMARACQVAQSHGDSERLAGIVAAVLARPWTADDRDALRRIGRSACAAGLAEAGVFHQRYSEFCVGIFALPVPLAWPVRTAGARVRVVALTSGEDVDDAAAEAVEAIAALAAEGTLDASLAVVGRAGPPAGRLWSEAAHALRVIALADDADDEEARRIAALDPDLLVDLCGMAANVGRLLALVPARRAVTLSWLRCAHGEPLVRIVECGRSGWPGWLRELASEVRSEVDCGVDLPTLTTLWNDAVGAHRDGRLDDARDSYRRFLELQPGSVSGLHLLAAAERDAGAPDAAEMCLRAALALAPRHVDAVAAAARLAIDRGDPDRALQDCATAIEAGVDDARVYRAQGLAQLARHDGAAAAAAFGRALERDPFDGETHYNHGVALQMQRNRAEAARSYQRAVFFKPDLTAADFNLGVLFQEQGAWEPAAAAYRAVLHADPRHVGAYRNLGEVLYAAGQLDRWRQNFERFEVNCPDALPLAVQALEVCQLTADFERLERYIDGLRNERFVATDETELVDSLEQLLYLLLFFDVEPQMLHKFAQTYDVAARHAYGAPMARSAERRPGRLRIGYLSADLRDHVMGKMIWSAVELHDRDRFEIFCYALSDASDAWTTRFRAAADRFEVLAGLDERTAALRIAEDDLDILVDLSTHTKGAKPGILALKPARVAITHVASAGTVGLTAIDFKLTDRFADVPENQDHQIERLLPMEGCVYPYRHVEPSPAVRFDRAPLGIPADAFVIGAFVTAMKLSRRCLRLWRDVLQRVPRAVIAFSPPADVLRPVYLRLASAVGIDAKRIVFIPQGRDEHENQRRYDVVDCVLDPLPFGGVNGTLEALDAGVPVVTLVGKRHGERTSFSILANLGVDATIAHNGRDYVDIAARLAGDAAFMESTRTAIRRGIASSPLTDRAAHARALEAAYEAALSLAAGGGTP